jgi:hypothetical protein
MPNPASPKRRAPGAGMKILITASALATTVAGWASLTMSQAAGAASPNPTPTGDPVADLPALPTVVPAPDLSKLTVSSSSAAPSMSPSAPAVIRKVGAPSVRSVSRPSSAPGPVTTTRSSHP